MFRDVEQRETPITRTDENVTIMLSIVTPRKPFCGHKSVPLLDKWLSPDWEGNMCDAMHDLKCLCLAIMKGLVAEVHIPCTNNGQSKRTDNTWMTVKPMAFLKMRTMTLPGTPTPKLGRLDKGQCLACDTVMHVALTL